MPLVVEHCRRPIKLVSSPPVPLEYDWTYGLLDAMNSAVGEDGGGSLFDTYARRVEVEHTFTRDYTINYADGTLEIKKGDVIRAWRERRERE